MTTSTFALSHANPVHAYFHNLGQAARTFGAALVAAAPQPSGEHASTSHAPVKASENAFAENRRDATEMLYSLAAQFEPTQPNQAAELRWLASRG